MSGVSDSEHEYTVGAIARLVGISVRTLHHYDHVGLVVPSGRTGAGYRVYDDVDVERLHQVLTYRQLGFSLEQIATLLDDPTVDAMAHLRDQHELLTDRIDRLRRMVAAVEDMMNAKKKGIQLTAAEQAEIFGDDWPGEEYAAEAEERWGDTDAWQQSRQRTGAYSKGDWQEVKADTDALEARLAEAMAAGVAPGSPEANALAEEHRASINRFYDCSHDMQVNLAQMYLADPRFTEHYDERAAGLAQYVRDVIVANADQQH
ncbi:MerR family transcriptional regulator [Gordonia sp. HNM0687]|uniref:MerR family transcriptional regulator n=1 Tax=Gordonia mangrovi TaxID=2665643 RepID=A0A6L7GT00_9ACTN|nr:MerR family transcriptional regulator [Gordonia mangrovi]MXP21648.1 MerR family transcriptional regulator [Gordonia mangrovi]UVF80385.1 MerR family transcriptional regulator [Gordonia mangrovi]